MRDAMSIRVVPSERGNHVEIRPAQRGSGATSVAISVTLTMAPLKMLALWSKRQHEISTAMSISWFRSSRPVRDCDPHREP
jgi:hypothetical protein